MMVCGRRGGIPSTPTGFSVKRAWLISWAVVVTVVAAGGVIALSARSHVLPKEGAVVGLKIDGRALPAGSDIRGHVAKLGSALADRPIALLVEGETVAETTYRELGVSLDVDEVTRRAAAVGRSGSWAKRLDDLLQARAGRRNVSLRFDVDGTVAATWVRRLKRETDEHATPARFDLPSGAIVPHVAGRYLDLDATIAAVLRATREGAAAIELPRTEIAPRVDSTLLKTLDRSRVVAKFRTEFAAGGDRAENIETAAMKLNGVVLAPGEVMSFNQVVGSRTLQNGFRPGWEIYKGEMVRGIGGGTCQVASTLHAAAFFGGLDVVERYPHSRPSAYIMLGLDATVAWPTVDMKLKNPWPFAIVIETRVSGGQIEVLLLGKRRPADVKFARETIGIMPFKRKVTETSWLPAGRVIKKQKGIRGYRIRRHRRIIHTDGTERVETTVDTYPATPEHFLVAPGTDLEAELPPAAGAGRRRRRGPNGRANRGLEGVFRGRFGGVWMVYPVLPTSAP